MPTYEFKCDNCGRHIERYFKFQDTHEVECSTCESKMRKVLQATPAHFAGSGWGKNG